MRVRGALVVVAVAAAGVAHAAPMYKWVDEKGVVHYTDKIPAEQLDKGSVELNKQGIPVKRTDPAPTPEQRRARQLEEERQKQIARERESVDRRDRALIESYTSLEEIDLARSRALGTLDSQVQSAQAYSVALQKRRQELEAKRRAYGANPVPPAIDRELESIASELAKQETLIAERRREMAQVSARYDGDKQRWQELQASGRSKELEASAAPRAAPATTPAAPAASPPRRTAAH